MDDKTQWDTMAHDAVACSHNLFRSAINERAHSEIGKFASTREAVTHGISCLRDGPVLLARGAEKSKFACVFEEFFGFVDCCNIITF